MKTLLTVVCLLLTVSVQAQFMGNKYKATLLAKYLLDAKDEGVLESQIKDPALTFEINDTYFKFNWLETKEQTTLKMQLDDIDISEGEKRYSFYNPERPGMIYYICFKLDGSGGSGFLKDPLTKIMYYFKFK